MEKYEINEELRSLSRRKPIVIKPLIPSIQKLMDSYQCADDEDVIVEQGMITSYEGEKIRLHVLKPREEQEALPCMLYFHGGGFALKASPHHYHFAKRCAAEVPCKVILADYRLLPKNTYPVAVEDAFAAYRWVVTYAEELKIDPQKLIVAGDSAGGNLAAVLPFLAKDRGLPVPAFQMLIYPLLDRRMETESMRTFTDTPMWNARTNAQMWAEYLGEQEIDHIEYVSPMEAGSVTHLPPAYIEVAELDPLRDEGIAYAKRLQDEGIPVEFYEVEGAVHGYDNAEGSRIVEEQYQKRIEALKNV